MGCRRFRVYGEVMGSLCIANLLKRPMRTAVSIFAVAVGVMMVLVLVGMTEGSLNEVARRMQNADADIIYHAKSYDPVVDFAAPLDDREGKKLEETFPDIAYTAPVFTQRISFLNRGHNIFGIRAEDFERVAHGHRIVAGKIFSKPDELLIDQRIAREAKIGVGGIVDVRGEKFTVSGIVEEGIPVRFLASIEALQKMEDQPGRVTFFYVKSKDPEKIGTLAGEIETKFRNRKCLLLGNYYQALAGSFRGLHEFIGAMLVVCSGVSFLVIFLAMYTTVIERTREIGVLKAIGASNAFIMADVFAMSMIICAAGVAAGFLLSLLGRWVLMSSFHQITVELTVERTLMVAALGIIAGAVGALYPATLAARSDPVEALTYE